MPYLVEIKTGSNVKDIGAVLLTIYGSKSQVEKIPLKETKSKKTPAFGKNQLDEFEFYGIDVGEVKKINIGHDGKGTWQLERVNIKKGGKSYRYGFRFVIIHKIRISQ